MATRDQMQRQQPAGRKFRVRMRDKQTGKIIQKTIYAESEGMARAQVEGTLPGVAESALYGLAVDAPSALTSLATLPMQTLSRLGQAVTGQERQIVDPGVELRRMIQERTGLRPGVTQSEQYAQAIGEGVGGAIPFLPAAAAQYATRPSLMAGAELVSGALGGLSAEAAEQQGAGPVGQMTAGVFGGGVLPAGVAPRVAGGITPAMAELAQEAGTSGPAIGRGAHELRRMLGDEYADEAISRLRETAEAFPPEAAPPMSGALEDLGAFEVSGLEQQLSRNPAYARRFADRAVTARRFLESERERILPKGLYEDVSDAMGERYDQLATLERNAWSLVPLEEMPSTPIETLKAPAQALVDEAGIMAGVDMPPEVRAILAAPDDYQVPMRELQGARSQVLSTIRKARSDRNAQMARRASMLLEAIDERIDTMADEMPRGASQAYLIARARTKAKHDVFDGKVLRNWDELGDARKLWSAIARQPNPGKAATQVLSAVGNSPAGRSALKRQVLEAAVLGGDPTSLTANRAIKQMKQHAAPLRMILGNEDYGRVMDHLQRVKKATTGSLGTAGQAFRTQSGNLVIEKLLQTATGTKIEKTRQILRFVGDWLKDTASTNEVLVKAILEPDFAARLAAIPADEWIPLWAESIKRGLAPRAAARSAAAAAASDQ